MRARRGRGSFWESRTWVFADARQPELLTLTEFIAVLHDHWGISVSREELVVLANIGAFPPQYLVFAGRVKASDRRVVDLMLPVYAAEGAPYFISLWRTEFALHVPVATTTVEQLRDEWGPRLAQAREELGLRRGARPDHTTVLSLLKLASDRSWTEMASSAYPTAPPEAQQLRSQVSRHRRKATTRVHKMHIYGPLPREMQPAVRLGLDRLAERIESEKERVGETLRQGGFPSVEDPDLMAVISYR